MKHLIVLGGGWGRRSAVALAVGWVCAAWADVEPWPTAQLAPAGYTAAINTPTADVLPWGGVAMGLTNNNPERRRTIMEGHFGSLNAGVGLLPGLELVGRLSYEGDLNCNLYDSRNCTGGQRDLSLSGKYQLPIELPLDTRIAAGFTDYGGNAAVFYRQVYGVATSTLGVLDLSLGYSKPMAAEKQVSQALMNGMFGSAVVRITDRFAAALENDTREWRAGMHYTQPLTDTVSVQAGLSRKLTDRTAQQSWQATVALNVALGTTYTPSGPGRAVKPAAQVDKLVQVAQPVQLTLGGQDQRGPERALMAQSPSVNRMAHELAALGFTQVKVRYWPSSDSNAALWRVEVEPRRWRQNQLDALGAALAAWRQTVGRQRSADELWLTLTYQQESVLNVYTSASCLTQWVQGSSRCDQVGRQTTSDIPSLLLSRGVDVPVRMMERTSALDFDVARVDGAPAWMPQVEIGPGLRTSVGTEYGLIDYSLALDAGVEVNLAPGLFWQGTFSTPLANSDDYDDGKVFSASRHRTSGMDSSMLSYWKALPRGLAVQISAGRIRTNETGGHLDAVWMSPDGRWRMGGIVGRYRNSVNDAVREPMLGTARWSVVPGNWHLEAVAGRFTGGDVGYRIASNHWFGDRLFKVYYRNSQLQDVAGSPPRKFIGFTFSLPLGPKEATPIGPVWVRGRDQWAWGLETKVGERDNYITSGYGGVPVLRHGLFQDVTSYDRNGVDDLLANSAKLRAILANDD